MPASWLRGSPVRTSQALPGEGPGQRASRRASCVLRKLPVFLSPFKTPLTVTRRVTVCTDAATSIFCFSLTATPRGSESPAQRWRGGGDGLAPDPGVWGSCSPEPHLLASKEAAAGRPLGTQGSQRTKACGKGLCSGQQPSLPGSPCHGEPACPWGCPPCWGKVQVQPGPWRDPKRCPLPARGLHWPGCHHHLHWVMRSQKALGKNLENASWDKGWALRWEKGERN